MKSAKHCFLRTPFEVVARLLSGVEDCLKKIVHLKKEGRFVPPPPFSSRVSAKRVRSGSVAGLGAYHVYKVPTGKGDLERHWTAPRLALSTKGLDPTKRHIAVAHPGPAVTLPTLVHRQTPGVHGSRPARSVLRISVPCWRFGCPTKTAHRLVATGSSSWTTRADGGTAQTCPCANAGRVPGCVTWPWPLRARGNKKLLRMSSAESAVVPFDRLSPFETTKREWPLGSHVLAMSPSADPGKCWLRGWQPRLISAPTCRYERAVRGCPTHPCWRDFAPAPSSQHKRLGEYEEQLALLYGASELMSIKCAFGNLRPHGIIPTRPASQHGMTILHWAAHHGRSNSVELLLRMGADREARTIVRFFPPLLCRNVHLP